MILPKFPDKELRVKANLVTCHIPSGVNMQSSKGLGRGRFIGGGGVPLLDEWDSDIV